MLHEYRVGEPPRVYPDVMSEVYPRGLAPLLRFWHQSSSDELVQCLVGTRRRHLFFDRVGRTPTRLWRCQDAGRAPSEFSCEDTSSLAVSDSFVEGDSFVRGGSLEQGGRYVRPID